MITVEASLSKGWLARELGVAFHREYYLEPRVRREVDLRCQEYARRELAELEILYTESNLGRRRFHGDDQVLVGGIQPNLILGMLLGADLISFDATDADISPNCLAERGRGELPSPEELLHHELVGRFDEQLRALREGTGLHPIPPFWWDASGRPAIHGALTTGQKFLGESFLMDLLLEPGRSRELMKWIAEAFVVLVRHFAREGQARIDEIHVGECSACLVSPEVFDEAVAPTLETIAAELGPLRLHSCGPSDHLLPCFEKLTALRSLDLGGETSLARVRELFGTEFPVSIAPLATDLARGSADRALAWARRIVEENDGGELVVLYHLEPEYNLEVVRSLHVYLREQA